MAKSDKLLIALLVAIYSTGGFMLYEQDRRAQESIIFFPLDKQTVFQQAETSLKPKKRKEEKAGWEAQWRMYSSFGTSAYLRQDVSLLFQNNRLAGIMNDWKQTKAIIQKEEQTTGTEDVLLEAVTFHYAELHHPDGVITSSQMMSDAQLYMIKKEAEKKNKETLGKKNVFFKERLAKEAFAALDLLPNAYTVIPLTSLRSYAANGFPGYTFDQSQAIIGKLWEGLYKNYITGIRTEDGTIQSPIGTAVPLLLFPKTEAYAYVAIQLPDGRFFHLKQRVLH